jgi:hypothetical protein
MPKFDKYYVVEFRYPIKVEDTDTAIEATSKAARICERVFGFKPENWYARIFEYTTGEKTTGPVKEYFYNPNSSNVREIEKNIGYFNDLIQKGIEPDELMDHSKIADKLEIKDGEVENEKQKKKNNNRLGKNKEQ